MKHSFKVLFAGVLLSVACGQQDNKKKTSVEAPVATQPQESDIAAGLPAAAIVRIPLDTEGKEDLTKAELRLQSSSEEAKDAQTVASSFEAGASAGEVKTLDELDKDSSAQSWCWGGYGYGYGYGAYYRPSYYYGGGYYNYGYGGAYNYGGYNYYYYPKYGYGYGYGY